MQRKSSSSLGVIKTKIKQRKKEETNKFYSNIIFINQQSHTNERLFDLKKTNRTKMQFTIWPAVDKTVIRNIDGRNTNMNIFIIQEKANLNRLVKYVDEN